MPSINWHRKSTSIGIAITTGIFLATFSLTLTAATVARNDGSIHDGNTIDHSAHYHEHHQHYWLPEYLHLLGPRYYVNRNWLVHREGKYRDNSNGYKEQPPVVIRLQSNYDYNPHRLYPPVPEMSPGQPTTSSPSKRPVNRDRVEFLKVFLAPFLSVASSFG